MKKNIILTLSLASLLTLSGCTLFGTSDSTEVESSVETQTSYSESSEIETSVENDYDYGDFTEIEDNAEAEATFNATKEMNEEIDDIESYESVTEYSGSYVDASKTITLNSTTTQRIGVDGTKFASDKMITNDYGTYSTYVRFDETKNMYYTYSALNFTYTDLATSEEVTIDSNMLSQDDDLNLDINIVYNSEMISDMLPYFHMLADVDYSDDMKIYSSTNAYYMFEQTTDESTNKAVFDENGILVELDLIVENVSIITVFKYLTNFDAVTEDNYEERDTEYNSTFLASMMMFMGLNAYAM